MAYDKVVDSTVLNNGLTAIANAIRAKGGTNGALSFPTGFADAIAAIEAGGGDDTYRIAKGTFTPASSVLEYVLFTADAARELVGKDSYYLLLIDGYSDNFYGANNAYAFATATGVIRTTQSVFTGNMVNYYMARNNSGALMSTVSQKPFTISSSVGIKLTAKSTSYPIYPMVYKWVMVMWDV